MAKTKKDHAYDPGTYLVLIPTSPNAPNGEFKHRLDEAKAEKTVAELKKKGKQAVAVPIGETAEAPPAPAPATK